MTPRERVSALAEQARNGTHWASPEVPEAAGGLASAPPPPRGTFGAPAEVAVRERGTVTRADERVAELGRESFRYAERLLTRHVAWPSDAALHTAILWACHANARDDEGQLIWRASPRLLVTSAQRGTGKSTVLDLLAILTHSRFGRMPKITAAAFAKVMGKFNEPVFIDEARMVFGNGQRSQELQGMMLAGYTPRTHSLTAKDNAGAPEKLFGAVAYAGKDNLITSAGDGVQDLLDRSMIIRMRRPSRHYPEIDESAEQVGELAARGMTAWAGMMRGQLIAASKALTAQACAGDDLDAGDVDAGILRSAQIWRPLIAIADVMGGDWPDRARSACEELSLAAGGGEDETDDLLGELADLTAGWDDES